MQKAMPASHRLLFAWTIFLAAFLLFLIEPLFAKLILPWFGGSAAVWATCLVFFQTALLLGYLYADATIRRLSPGRQSVLHLGALLVSLLWLPIAPQVFWRSHVQVDPAWRILGLLTFSIGFPFVLLSSTSPLLQTWYSRRNSGRSPYHLFALSNLASLLALLSFPFLIEPRLSSRHQSVLWSTLYGVFGTCCALVAWVSRKYSPGGVAESDEMEKPAGEAAPETREADQSQADQNQPSPPTRLLWLSLSACGSMMLLSVTNHLS